MYSIWACSFGGLFKIKTALFHPDMIIATDHAAVHPVFANSDVYVKSPAFLPPIKNMLGKGLVWAEGGDWHRQRKMLSPAFSSESAKEMTSVIYECAERLETRLMNLILLDSAPAKDGTSLNIVPYITTCTLDIIGAVALSHSFSAICAASWTSHVNTGLKPLAFFASIVDCGPQGKDIISILLRGRRLGKDAYENLSDEQILDNVHFILVSLVMVGHETTAGSLIFTLWELARQPAIQDRLRTEVLSYGRKLSYEDIQNLEFLDAVVKEGRRLALRDDLIPLSTSLPEIGATFRIKKASPFTPMRTNPRVWEDRDPATLPHDWSGLLTFCDGLRNCLGWRLAVLELKIILATLVRSFVFSDTGVHVEEGISPTLQPVVDGRGGNLPLRLKLL
ncbi:cytochrome P450 [Mycena capillaripes]|nr:cytochrome P450 [Mycena capillaripes]